MRRNQWRAGLEWAEFEELIRSVVKDLGLSPVCQPDIKGYHSYPGDYAVKIFSHSSKRKAPEANLFYMQMHHKRLFTLDTLGWGAKHSLSNTFNLRGLMSDSAISHADRDLKEIKSDLEGGETKHAQSRHRGGDRVKSEYIFVPLQTPKDEVIVEHSPHSVVEFIKIVTEAANAAKRHVIFKVHPYAMNNLHIRAAVLYANYSSSYVTVRDGHVTDLILGSDAVVCQNSGVGFEALLLGRPVFTTGECDYSQATVTSDMGDLSGLISFFSHPTRPPLVQDFMRWYVDSVGYFMRRDGSNRDRLKNRLLLAIETAMP